MKDITKHCLLSLANTLYTESMIPEDVCENACNENRGKNERAIALLGCVEAKIGTDFAKFVDILRSDSYCESLADKLVLSYNGNLLASY